MDESKNIFSANIHKKEYNYKWRFMIMALLDFINAELKG